MEYLVKQNQSFRKSERLSSKKTISGLFDKGNSLYSFPFKIFFSEERTEALAVTQILITVSKKHFKSAVDRNRVKRLIRESYRKNKQILQEQGNINLKITFVYTHKEILTYKEIEKKITLVFRKILETVKK